MDHEQRINMEFCLKLQNKSAKETHEMLKLVYGDAAVTMKTVNRRFERFGNGCESVGDEGRSGRPSASTPQDNVERVSEMIRSNRRLTIRRISEDLNISCASVEDISTFQRGVTGTARMLHPLTHSSISRKVREQM